MYFKTFNEQEQSIKWTIHPLSLSISFYFCWQIKANKNYNIILILIV